MDVFGKLCLLAAPEISEIQLAETQNDSGTFLLLLLFNRLCVKYSWL